MSRRYHVLEFGYDDVRVVTSATMLAMGVTDQGYWEVGDGYETFEEANRVRNERLDENEAELDEFGLDG